MVIHAPRYPQDIEAQIIRLMDMGRRYGRAADRAYALEQYNRAATLNHLALACFSDAERLSASHD